MDHWLQQREMSEHNHNRQYRYKTEGMNSLRIYQMINFDISCI
jgi:hypothetical protein